MKIFFKKENNKFAGAGCIEKLKINGVFEQELPTKDYDSIEIEEKDWLDFRNNNKAKDSFVENGVLVGKDKIELIEEIKRRLILKRRASLKETFEIWFDDVENMPQEIKDKRDLAKIQIKEIEAITKKEELTIYNI